MARYVSREHPVSVGALKRRPLGAVVMNHNGSEDTKFTRVHGGWRRQRTDFIGLRPEIVSSAAVAAECNNTYGCKDSWARIY